MTLTLNLSPKDEARLAEQAEAAGLDVQAYIERLLHRTASRASLDEVLRPVREAFRESGMTDDELGNMLEKAKHEMRAEQYSLVD